MARAVLTLNAGSSSFKFALFRLEGQELRLAGHGQMEEIASAPRFVAQDPAGNILERRCWDRPPAFTALLDQVIGWAENHLGDDRLAAVGHRVVHGGPHFDRPRRVTSELLAALDRLVPLAPLHQPHNIAPMRLIAAARPALPQVACFDTSFHHAMPAVATRFALPREYEVMGVRRYGFHGLSYEYIARRLRDIAPALAEGRVIVAHLGNGASLCALRAGQSIDTTMGFSALDGLVMGTRCGNLDPGVPLYLAQQRGLTPGQLETLLYRQSGLLGVSGGIASDMSALSASADPRAREAIELFVYRLTREIGALVSVLGGLDGLIFTAGIGEHAPNIRALVCARLRWLGVQFDAAANAANAGLISKPSSAVTLRVIPTDEEAMIARHSIETLEL